MLLRLLYLLLLLAMLVQGHNETLIREFVKQQFQCSTNAPATQKVLVLSPASKNLPLEWFEDLPLVTQDKRANYPLTFSAIISNHPETCLSFIELPQMYNDGEILSSMKWLLKRCFNKVIIHLPRSLDWQGTDVSIFVSFMRLFIATYGQRFSSKMGVVVVEDNVAGQITMSESDFEEHLNQFASLLNLQKPPITFIAPLKTSSSEFLQFFNGLDSEVICKAEECLDNNKGFFMRNRDKSGKGLPWLGYPAVVEFNEGQTAEISCYSNDLNKDLELATDDEDDLFGGGGQQVQYNNKKTVKVNKLQKTTFTIKYREDRVGFYTCRNGNGKSLHSVELKYQEDIWSQWSEWSKCDQQKVGIDKVRRSRKLLGEVQSQDRYCRCSDLQEMPRPRIVLLGKTGVGKSSVGSQLFGDRNSFVVGHNIGSETLSITAKSDHYLGYGECLTIIDTPGVKDTEGRDYEHTLNMKEALQRDIKSVDIFLLLLSGKDTRFDEGTQELLLWYQAIFGVDMWKHLIVETTFWGHSETNKADRMSNRGGLTEAKRTQDWEAKFHKAPYRVDKSITIPFVYIDPVVDIFADHCSKSKNAPDERETREFYKWTSEFINIYKKNRIPPFDCTRMCQAPRKVFSGMPVLVAPRDGRVTFRADASNEQYIEWQFLQTNTQEDMFAQTLVILNGKPLKTNRLNKLIDLPEEGLQYKIEKNNDVQKIVTVRLYLLATPKIKKYTNEAVLRNPKGQAAPAIITWTRSPVVGRWSEWSQCSVECIDEDGRMGERTRKRSCTEGFNSEKTCQSIIGENLTQDMKEIATDSCPKASESTGIWCPQDAVWTEWAEWTNCNVNCGQGQQSRRRFCLDGKHGGTPCSKTSEDDTKICNNPKECPKHCKFGGWKDWTPCPTDCFEDFPPQQERERKVLQEAVGDGFSCDLLQSKETRYCQFMKKCPVHGKWTPWGSWSTCSQTCQGQKTRNRYCQEPRNGGNFCNGETMEVEQCNEEVNCACEFSEWSDWTTCTVSCGSGTQTRSRTRSRTDFGCNESNGAIKEEQSCHKGNCPSSGGSCLLGSTRILMQDLTYKAVEDLKIQDVILDGSLNPVQVIVLGKVYLGTGRDLYQFGINGPVFTSDHQFVSSLNPQLQVGAQSIDGLLQDKPQMIEMKDDIQQLDDMPELLQYVNQSIIKAPFNMQKYPKMDPNTPLYYILTSGQDASYIADNFVSRDGFPEFDLWPWTYATFFLILNSEKLPTPELITNLEEENKLALNVKQLVSIWKKEIEKLDEIQELELNGFSTNQLWPDKHALMQNIDARGHMEFARFMDTEGANVLHSVLENDDIPVKKRYALMLRIVQVTEKYLNQ